MVRAVGYLSDSGVIIKAFHVDDISEFFLEAPQFTVSRELRSRQNSHSLLKDEGLRAAGYSLIDWLNNRNHVVTRFLRASQGTSNLSSVFGYDIREARKLVREKRPSLGV